MPNQGLTVSYGKEDGACDELGADPRELERGGEAAELRVFVPEGEPVGGLKGLVGDHGGGEEGQKPGDGVLELIKVVCRQPRDGAAVSGRRRRAGGGRGCPKITQFGRTSAG
jgi:hypothetical protein